MKKIFTFIFIGMAAISLVACGSSDNNTKTTADTAAAQTSVDDTMAAATDDGSGWKAGDTVYIDVPAKAGGGTDLYARYVTQSMTEILDGVNFVVINYDTAEVGSLHGRDAAADGLNLLPAACTNMDNYLSGLSEVNPVEDMRVVAKINEGGPQAWIAGADAPYDTIPELIEYAKEHPGELTIGCTLGGTSQLIWIGTFNAVGEEIYNLFNYVQCQSEADKLTNVASGSIDLGNCSINNALSYEESGKVKVLGTIGPEVAMRDAIAELVDQELSDAYLSMPEQGIDFTWNSGYYLTAPAATPDEIVTGINEQLQQLNDSDTYAEGMKTMATFFEIKNLADSVADFQEEWEFQCELMSQMGLNVR